MNLPHKDPKLSQIDIGTHVNRNKVQSTLELPKIDKSNRKNFKASVWNEQASLQERLAMVGEKQTARMKKLQDRRILSKTPTGVKKNTVKVTARNLEKSHRHEEEPHTSSIFQS